MLSNKKIKAELKNILHLPFLERLTHAKARRTVVGITVSISIMIFASCLAKYGDQFFTNVPHPVIDAFAYLLHGLGSIPFVKFAEPAWLLIIGE